MPTATDRLVRQLQVQDALLKLEAEKSLRRYVEQAWPILGKGGNRIVVDDPHNPTQAESETQR